MRFDAPELDETELGVPALNSGVVLLVRLLGRLLGREREPYRFFSWFEPKPPAVMPTT